MFRCPSGTFWHINGTCGKVINLNLKNIWNLFLNQIFPIQVDKFLNGTACAKNIQCDDTKSLTCSPTLYICACPAGYYWDTTSSPGNCSKKNSTNCLFKFSSTYMIKPRSTKSYRGTNTAKKFHREIYTAIIYTILKLLK